MNARCPDVIAQDHGSIWTFYPRSQAAQEWWEQNVAEGPTFGRNHSVETRFVQDIIEGLQAAGFVVNH